jgi:pimeloyl-ACP methyl ester carboxylesterase
VAGLRAERDTARAMSQGWHAIERGTGRPLVLLHGIGMASSAWNPILDHLAVSRRVIALDLPGFGRSEPLPPSIEPTGEAIAKALIDELAERGIDSPVDIAGNSLGGLVALEAAKAGQARSVVALSPAGLWEGSTPTWVRLQFGSFRFACRRMPRLMRWGARVPPLRTLALLGPVAWKGWRVSADEAAEVIDNFAHGDAFDDVLEAASEGFSGGRDIDVPVTIAFGTRDLLLLGKAERVDELPAHTHWRSLSGCGHIPMSDDPEAVARIVLEGTEPSKPPG